MLELEKIKKIDTEKMYQVYDDWPKIAEKHITKKTSQIDIKDVDHIVFVGMGGSGTIGDILSSVLSKTVKEVMDRIIVEKIVINLFFIFPPINNINYY